MLHMDARFEDHQTSGSEEDVCRFFLITHVYGSGGHIGHVACKLSFPFP